MIKIIRKATMLTAGIILSISLFTGIEQSVNASYQEPLSTAESDNTVSPQADVIGWRYKVINNRLHKRQFNYSTGKWIGLWIPAG